LSFLIELIEKLKEEGAGFESLSDGVNTTSAGGKLYCISWVHWPDLSAH
jgi:hypothetical protein